MAKQKIANKFWNFTSPLNSEPAELILYGDISSTSWWDDDITPRQFNDDLNALGDVEEIVVRINSGGGDVFAANAIYTRLKDHKARITVKIDGWAASAATIIAMAGDVIEIPANGVFMIHDPKMGTWGYYSQEDFIKLSEELKVIKQSIINGYALKTGKSTEEIAELMAKETWYDGKEAVESGFCDKLMFEEIETQVENSSRVVVNAVSFDLTRYPNMPISLLNHRPAHTNGGFSNTSKKIQEKESGSTMEIKTVDELKAAYPDLTKQIANNAAVEERNRIKDIEELSLDGFEEIVKNAKFEKPINAAEVAIRIIAEQKKQGTNYLVNRATDVNDSNVNNVGNSNQEDISGKSGENPYDAAIDKLFPEKK
ncbi:Clp protease ClpP [Tissierella sp. MSJ-40]|uniref:Clp protease ClpP n=1 Tax=Tissierella simiarum TaxID=2841534 RepID=A0ABS6E5V6_9FIRM|nr:head maturation protease, ClpP-related [Tissierella simiarum]MBU5438298.1 Clp protease ClpP [Tissierella simiarum]